MKNIPSLQTAQKKAEEILRRLRPYSLLIFVVFVGILYGFVLLRLNTLSNATPSNDVVNKQVKASAVPHIDRAVVDKIQNLQDNSVSVRTLFEQARNNPFH
jgi:hypothetical protein